MTPRKSPSTRAQKASRAAASGQAPQTTPAGASVLVLKEQEPNDTPAQAASFAIPAVLEGAVGKPGDIDFFRFVKR